jgi:hypothetical protein
MLVAPVRAKESAGDTYAVEKTVVSAPRLLRTLMVMGYVPAFV